MHICKNFEEISKKKMHSLNSSDQNWTYNNNIDCYFAICETCFWTATIFNSVKNDDNSDKRSISTCPICSSKDISMISIPIHGNDANLKCNCVLTINQYNH
jgi:hypothetical protein